MDPKTEPLLCAPAVPVLEQSGDADCPVAKPAKPDAFDEALALAKIDRCTLGYTEKDWAVYEDLKDPYRLPWFHEVHDHAMRVPGFGRMITRTLDDAAASKTPVTGALQLAAFGLGAKDAPCPTAFDVGHDQPLARAIATVIREAGGEPDDAALEEDAADVPLPLQEAVAEVVLAAAEADAAWRALAKPLTPADRLELAKVSAIHLRSKARAPNYVDAKVQSLLSTRFDEAALVRGASTLALRIERANLARFAGLSGFELTQDTPLGRIVIRDAGDHVHESKNHVLLSVDTGGADTYRYAAGAVDGESNEHHVGLAIDLAGNDTYGYVEVADPNDGKRLPSDGAGRFKPSQPVETSDGPVSLSDVYRQGAARLGYGMLFDLGEGNDRYRSLRFSQGYAAGGVGVLYDAGGNDRYEAEAAAQGAAHFGVGLLMDAGGNDTYRSYSLTQGFAGPRAVGILYDQDGSDHYSADNGDPADGGDPLYWTPQRPGKGNNSFAQGAAFGRRADADGVYMSGGLGVLRDKRGADFYEGSTFTQGSGYWFGTGVIADGEGDDEYDARYYMQGAGAHFGMALFLEEGGSDRYDQKLVPTATSIGVGHDFTVAWHVDLGGNDVYRAPVLSLGSGNANGIGVLVNVGGNDTYAAAAEPTFGAANLTEEWHKVCEGCRSVPTTGIFVDVGGTDTYDTPNAAAARGDDKDWSTPCSPAEYNAIEHSVGIDRANGEVSLP